MRSSREAGGGGGHDDPVSAVLPPRHLSSASRIGFHAPGVGGRIGLIETKLIEVVIARSSGVSASLICHFRAGLQVAVRRRGLWAIVALKPVEQIAAWAAG